MVNDITIISGILFFFIGLGVILPYVNEDFGGDVATVNVEGVETSVGDETVDVGTISAYKIVLSVLSMFFWTFGALPFWLDAFFLILRVTFAITIARNIWPGGGS